MPKVKGLMCLDIYPLTSVASSKMSNSFFFSFLIYCTSIGSTEPIKKMWTWKSLFKNQTVLLRFLQQKSEHAVPWGEPSVQLFVFLSKVKMSFPSEKTPTTATSAPASVASATFLFAPHSAALKGCLQQLLPALDTNQLSAETRWWGSAAESFQDGWARV